MFAKLQNLQRTVGDLLENADDKTTNSDLQSLTKEVGEGSKKAAGFLSKAHGLDLGLREGWKELTNQVREEMKDPRTMISDAATTVDSGDSPQKPPKPASKHAQRLADLRERVRELEMREDERQKVRERAQHRFIEAEEELKKLQSEGEQDSVEEASDNVLLPAHDEKIEAMRKEFYEHQAQADGRLSGLRKELDELKAACEPLEAEKGFFKDKAEHMLAARGLEDVPEEIQRRLDQDEAETVQRKEPQQNAAESAARTENDLVQEEHSEQQHAYQRLDAKLQQLMRDSDAAMERIDIEQRCQRELESSLEAAKANAVSEAAAAEAAAHQAILAKEAKEAAESRHREDAQKARESHRDESSPADTESGVLRRDADLLRRKIQDASKENTALDGRLRKYRAAAAEDLERAVPLASASSCWQSVDGPTMKAVTVLVRSSCLRRTFALHLIGTYTWLFFLIFWLEKHP